MATAYPSAVCPMAATFWVNASRVIPPLTIGNVNNPCIFTYFIFKKEKRNNIFSKKKNKKKEERNKIEKTNRKTKC